MAGRVSGSAAETGAADRLIPVGRVGAPHGVRGWIRIDSSARPPESVLAFAEWWLGPPGAERAYRLEAGHMHSERVVARLAGVHDREAAASLRHAVVSVRRSMLPVPGDGEWYWADLVGLTVETVDGERLGTVDHLIATGANDVLVVHGERERLIPWIAQDVVRRVDPGSGRVIVAWDPDF